MLDQLVKLVEQNAGEAIVHNDAVPNEQNGAAIREVASQIFGGLQDKAKEGNVQDVVSMFNGNGGAVTGNPIVGQLISRVAGSLASKFGISHQQAMSIADSLLPMIMSQFVNKTNDPNDSDFDLQGMLRRLTGNTNVDAGSLMDRPGGDNAKDLIGNLGKMFRK